jgi:hypothetical protein
MSKIKEINMDILPEEVKKQLLDFYEYLANKYGKKKLKDKKVFFESVKLHSFKLPEDYKFNREELHER